MKGSEAYSILDFRVTTTWSEESLITTCSVESRPHHLNIEPPLHVHSQNGKRPRAKGAKGGG